MSEFHCPHEAKTTCDACLENVIAQLHRQEQVEVGGLKDALIAKEKTVRVKQANNIQLLREFREMETALKSDLRAVATKAKELLEQSRPYPSMARTTIHFYLEHALDRPGVQAVLKEQEGGGDG